MTLEQLCARSEHIVLGRVEKIAFTSLLWPGIGTLPFTKVAIAIDEEWKGEVEGPTWTVYVPGGKRPDGSSVIVSEMPRFRLHERVLVFSHSRNGHSWVYGNEQGKYTVLVERVVGKPGLPIAEDCLTPALEKRVRRILARLSR